MAGAANPGMTQAAAPMGGFGTLGMPQRMTTPTSVFQPQQSRAPQPAAGSNVFSQASGALRSAISGLSGELRAQPSQFGRAAFGAQQMAPSVAPAPVQVDAPQNIEAQTAAGGIQTYMNPYTQQVVDLAAQDIERQRQMAANQLGAQAQAAGAFGGSRQAVAESLTNAEFARQAAQAAAGLRQQGFQTALGAAQQDIANRMQADIANQQAQMRARELAAERAMRGAQLSSSNMLARQQMEMEANRAAASQRLAAAQALGGLARTGYDIGTGLLGQQQQFGSQQQQLNQALINAARGQFAGFAGAPAASLGLPLQAVGAANMGQRTQTQGYSPGLFDFLSLGAGIGGGIF